MVSLRHQGAASLCVGRETARALRELAARGAPLALASVAEGAITRADVLAVQALATPEVTARYAVAAALAVGVGSALYTLAHMSLRVLTQVPSEHFIATYRRLFKNVGLISLATGLLLIAVFPLLAPMLFGEHLGHAAPRLAFAVYMLGLPIVMGSRIAVMALLARERRSAVLTAQAVGASAVVVGVPAGFAVGGLSGAAAGSVMGDLALLLVARHFLVRLGRTRERPTPSVS
jgi:O-antigen/teichoic acid export membrane protein